MIRKESNIKYGLIKNKIWCIIESNINSVDLFDVYQMFIRWINNRYWRLIDEILE
jgi:hypothetical protein